MYLLNKIIPLKVIKMPISAECVGLRLSKTFVNKSFLILQMCVALRYYATGSNYSVLGDFQGLSKSTVCRAVGEVTEFLFNNQTAFIKWPTTWEAKYDIARQYHEKSAVPFCMGAIDGTHVAILSLCNNEVAYVNRKGYHSLNVMVSIIHYDEAVGFGIFMRHT